jgi:hypothetical protein
MHHTSASLLAVPSSIAVAVTNPDFSFIEILKVISNANDVELLSPLTLIDFSSTNFSFIQKVSSKEAEVVLLIEDFMFVDDAIR